MPNASGSGEAFTRFVRRAAGGTLPATKGPSAVYLAMMDMFLFVKEPCAYAEDRVDPYLTIFWHPTEDRVVGFKIKGFKYIFNRIRDELNLKDDGAFVRAYEVLEQVFKFPREESGKPEQERARDYVVARSIAGSEAGVKTSELQPAA
jgi:hypothetical protein